MDTIQLYRKGRKNSTIPREYYDSLFDFILLNLKIKDEGIFLNELIESARQQISCINTSTIAFHLLQVKYDLESRGLINVDFNKNREQRISLKSNYKGFPGMRYVKSTF